MSFFAVTIEEISEITNHPNAERLVIASLKGMGFRFVVAKGSWKVGDRCLYFPLDAILPEEILKTLGVEGKLAGAKKNRIKTIKLRGEISQGLVGPLSLIESLSEADRTPEGITKFLGVTKHEAEISLPCSKDARLVDLPFGVGIYDIENCERFPDSLESLMDQVVHISEKLEGSHFALAYVDQKIWVCQRRFALDPIPDKPKHFFWEAAEDLGLISLVHCLIKDFSCTQLVLRGEIIGPNIQSNIYYLQKREVRFFDLMIDHNYVDALTLIDSFKRHGKENLLVPVISADVTLRDWLGQKSLRDASNGESLLGKTIREGIIIRPLKEQNSAEMNGRLVLKQISPEYLALH